MPDPVKNSYNVIKPYAYENTTKPVHSKAEVNGTRFDGNGTLSGASLGSAAGPYGAAIGAAAGLATDLWRAHFSKQSAERANEEAKKAADAAYARNAAEARAAREWNSEQSQIRRMRMAGLSPGLAYGQMSPSTAQPATADQQDVYKADNPNFRGADEFIKALQLLISQQQADTAAAAQASTASLQGSQTQLNLIDALTRNQSNLAVISEILSRKDLTDTQKNEIVTLLAGKQQIQNAEVENLNAAARNANANAAVTEQTGVGLAQSEIAFNNARTTTERERPYEIRQNIQTSGDLASYYRRQSSLLAQQYGIKQHKIDAVADWLDEHGYSRDYLGFALDFCDDMASNVGSDISKQTISTLFSWLNGGNWLSYIGSRQNTHDINVNRSNISENQIQSYEKIAAGHDATRLQSIDSYFEHAARSHDKEFARQMNQYRAEWVSLNKGQKSQVTEYQRFLESQGYDEDTINQRVAYYVHNLYVESRKK